MACFDPSKRVARVDVSSKRSCKSRKSSKYGLFRLGGLDQRASRRAEARWLSFSGETFVAVQMPGYCQGRRVSCQRPRAAMQEVFGMLTITPRAARVSIPMAIMYRRAGEEDWLSGKVVNLSESGVLF